MKKSDFYAVIGKQAHLTKKAAEDAIESFLEEVRKALRRGDKVVLSGFGTFSVGKVGAKDVVPFGKADKRTTVKSHHVVSFKAAKPLRKAIW